MFFGIQMDDQNQSKEEPLQLNIELFECSILFVPIIYFEEIPYTVFDKRCKKVEHTACTTRSAIKREGQLSNRVQ